MNASHQLSLSRSTCLAFVIANPGITKETFDSNHCRAEYLLPAEELLRSGEVQSVLFVVTCDPEGKLGEVPTESLDFKEGGLLLPEDPDTFLEEKTVMRGEYSLKVKVRVLPWKKLPGTRDVPPGGKRGDLEKIEHEMNKIKRAAHLQSPTEEFIRQSQPSMTLCEAQGDPTIGQIKCLTLRAPDVHPKTISSYVFGFPMIDGLLISCNNRFPMPDEVHLARQNLGFRETRIL